MKGAQKQKTYKNCFPILRFRELLGSILGRKTSENKADFLVLYKKIEKMKKWSDGVVTSICAKKKNIIIVLGRARNLP